MCGDTISVSNDSYGTIGYVLTGIFTPNPAGWMRISHAPLPFADPVRSRPETASVYQTGISSLSVNKPMRKITVAMVLFPGFQLLDIAGPRDAFAEVRILGKGACEYEMLTVGTTRGTIPSSSGLVIQPDRTIFDPCPPFDTVIVPGGLGVFEVLEDSTLSAWLVQQRKLCRRIAAICNGVFAFGAAGLIDNRTVATHWMDVARLSAMFPTARVEADQIYVKDGNIYSTAGVTAGIDLALVMISASRWHWMWRNTWLSMFAEPGAKRNSAHCWRPKDQITPSSRMFNNIY
jgi:transcriptional regulator GlxA family with amidase domain